MAHQPHNGASYPPPLFMAELEAPNKGPPMTGPVFEMPGESALTPEPQTSDTGGGHGGTSSTSNKEKESVSQDTDDGRPIQANPWPFYLEHSAGDAATQPPPLERQDEAKEEPLVQANPWPFYLEASAGDVPNPGATGHRDHTPAEAVQAAEESDDGSPPGGHGEGTSSTKEEKPQADILAIAPGSDAPAESLPALPSVDTDTSKPPHSQGQAVRNPDEVAASTQSNGAAAVPDSAVRYQPYSPPVDSPTLPGNSSPYFQSTHHAGGIPYRPYQPPGSTSPPPAGPAPSATARQTGASPVAVTPAANSASPPYPAGTAPHHFHMPPPQGPPSTPSQMSASSPQVPMPSSPPSTASHQDSFKSASPGSTQLAVSVPPSLGSPPPQTPVQHSPQQSSNPMTQAPPPPVPQTSISPPPPQFQYPAAAGPSPPGAAGAPAFHSYGPTPSPPVSSSYNIPQPTYAAQPPPQAQPPTSPGQNWPTYTSSQPALHQPQTQPLTTHHLPHSPPPAPYVTQIPVRPGSLPPPAGHQSPYFSHPTIASPPPQYYPPQATYAPSPPNGVPPYSLNPASPALSPPPLPPRPSSSQGQGPLSFGAGPQNGAYFPPPPKSNYRPPPLPPRPAYGGGGKLFGSSSAKKWVDKTNQVLEETIGDILQPQIDTRYRQAPPPSGSGRASGRSSRDSRRR